MNTKMRKTLKILYPDEFSRKSKRPKKEGFFQRNANSIISFFREMERSKLLIGLTSLVSMIVLAYGVHAFNRFTTYKQGIRTGYANIEKEVQRRNDLINNLVPPTLNYLRYERDLFTHVVEIRKDLLGQNMNIKALPEGDGEMPKFLPGGLEAKLPTLMGIFENYPDLKASKPFSELMKELIETENRIAQSRKAFNENVKIYNTYITRIPASFVASVLGYKQETWFEASGNASEVPSMKQLDDVNKQ